MRLLLPLAVLALAGCETLRDETFPTERGVYEADGKAFATNTVFDPLEFAYFTQVTNADLAGPGLTAEDQDVVEGLVMNQVGPEFCDGRKMALSEFNSENLPGRTNMRFLASRGIYQIVTRCTLDMPEFFPELPTLPSVEDLPKVEDLPDADDILPDLSLI